MNMMETIVSVKKHMLWMCEIVFIFANSNLKFLSLCLSIQYMIHIGNYVYILFHKLK